MHLKPESLITDAYLARRENRSREAKPIFEEAVELSRIAGDGKLLARALSGLGQIERDLGNTGPAGQHYEAAVEILRKLDDQLLLAHALRHVGDIFQQQGHSKLAYQNYEEALAIYRVNGSAGVLDMANALAGYARCQQTLGDLPSAKLLWLEARDLYAHLDVRGGVEEADKRLAALDANLAALPD